MKMNYQSGDRLKNRYLSNDAFTSLKNKLGGRSITSLGNNRRRNSYKIANQGFDLLEYKSLIYKLFLTLLILIIIIYIIPQTRYFIHGFNSKIFSPIENSNTQINTDDILSYDIAPHFLKTDLFLAKQKDFYIDNGLLVYDFVTDNIIGFTNNNSSSTIDIRLFSDSGYKNDLLIEQTNISEDLPMVNTSSSTSSSTENISQIIKDKNITYKSYIFEGMGYGQIMAKVPPKTDIKKDTYVYIRTVNGLKPIAKIIDVNEDNKSTFTLVYAQLIVAPQNIYKVLIK